eukprot:PhM_4_TR2090/c1_g2_i2/m.20502
MPLTGTAPAPQLQIVSIAESTLRLRVTTTVPSHQQQPLHGGASKGRDSVFGVETAATQSRPPSPGGSHRVSVDAGQGSVVGSPRFGAFGADSPASFRMNTMNSFLGSLPQVAAAQLQHMQAVANSRRLPDFWEVIVEGSNKRKERKLIPVYDDPASRQARRVASVTARSSLAHVYPTNTTDTNNINNGNNNNNINNNSIITLNDSFTGQALLESTIGEDPLSAHEGEQEHDHTVAGQGGDDVDEHHCTDVDIDFTQGVWILGNEDDGSGCTTSTSTPPPSRVTVKVCGLIRLAQFGLARQSRMVGNTAASSVSGSNMDSPLRGHARHTEWSEISTPLLPVVELEQGVIFNDRLQLHWRVPFADNPPLELCDITHAIEVEVDEHLVSTVIDATDSQACGGSLTVECPKGNSMSQAYKVRARTVGGSFCSPITCYTIAPSTMLLSVVGEDYAVLNFGSARSEPFWQEWALIKNLKFHVWTPSCVIRRTSHDADAPLRKDQRHRVQAHVAQEDTAFAPNKLVMAGLRPNTIYHSFVEWGHMCGGRRQRKYFRFVTQTVMAISRVLKVGMEFMEVELSRASAAKRLSPAHDVHDDEDEDDIDVSGGIATVNRYRTTKPWHDVDPIECAQVPLLYRVRITNKEEDGEPTSVDFEGVLDASYLEAPQSVRINRLCPGASYSLQVRCLGTARGEYVEAHHTDSGKSESERQCELYGRAFWGQWSEACVVHTIFALTLKVEQRGVSSLDLQWSRPKSKDMSAEDYSGVRTVLVGLVACDADVDLSDEGDRDWGTTPACSGGCLVQRFDDADIFGQVNFPRLRSNRTYRVSINMCDDEGVWSGRRSILVSTLRHEVTNAGVDEDGGALPYIDEGYHLREQELPVWDDGVGSCRMMYQVHVGETRVKELRLLASNRRSHVGLVAMQLDATEIGEDYAVLAWRVLDVAEGGNASRSHDINNTPSALSNATARPHTSIPRRELQQHLSLSTSMLNTTTNSATGGADVRPATAWGGPATRVTDGTTSSLLGHRVCAYVINRERRITEYKVKVCLLEGDREEAKSSLLCEIYFRSASRSTRLLGLNPGLRYSVSICRFDEDLQQWVPSWSNPVVLRPAKELALNVVGISTRGVLLEWRRTRELSATTPIVAYKLAQRSTGATDDKSSADSREWLLDAPTSGGCPPSHFVLRDLDGPRVLRLSVAPRYRNGSWGCHSNTVGILVFPLTITATVVAQSAVTISWDPRVLADLTTSCDLETVRRCTSSSLQRIIFTAESVDGTVHIVSDEVPHWARPDKIGNGDTSEHVFNGLRPLSRYKLRAVAVGVVALSCRCCTRGALPPEKGVVPALEITTDGELSVKVVSVGESYVTLRWDSVGRWKGAAFEVVLTDIETQTHRLVSVPASATMHSAVHKTIEGLCYGRVYNVFVRCASGSRSPNLVVRTLSMLHVVLKSVNVDEGYFEVAWSRRAAPSSSPERRPVEALEDDGIRTTEVCVAEVMRTPTAIKSTAVARLGQVASPLAPTTSTSTSSPHKTTSIASSSLPALAAGGSAAVADGGHFTLSETSQGHTTRTYLLEPRNKNNKSIHSNENSENVGGGHRGGGVGSVLRVPGKPRALYRVTVREAEVGSQWGRWSLPVSICLKNNNLENNIIVVRPSTTPNPTVAVNL